MIHLGLNVTNLKKMSYKQKTRECFFYVLNACIFIVQFHGLVGS